jgi:HPt (histidine-containing phosphotransfer) domain-containing protein
MTANARDEDRRRCSDAGMNDFVSKPINPKQLFSTLARWLKRASPSEVDACGGVIDMFVDLGELSKMWQGNYEKIEKCAHLFVDVAHKDFQELETVIRREEVEMVSEIGHRAKSSSLTLGARKLADIYLQMEALKSKEDLPKAMELLEALRPLIERIKDQVEVALRELKK